jgi:hypothetical protein
MKDMMLAFVGVVDGSRRLLVYGVRGSIGLIKKQSFNCKRRKKCWAEHCYITV